MAVTPTPAVRTSIADTLAVYLQRRVLIVMFLGFSSGCRWPFRARRSWSGCARSEFDLGTIGLFALVGTPYTLKFPWAPLIDALDVPVLSRLIGPAARLAAPVAVPAHRRDRVSWRLRPVGPPLIVACGALMVATASATQDIVVDAFALKA